MLVQVPFLATSTNPFIPWNHHWLFMSLSLPFHPVAWKGTPGDICWMHLSSVESLPHSLTRGTWQLWSLFLISCELHRGWGLQSKAFMVKLTSQAFLIAHPLCFLQCRHTGCLSGALRCHSQDLCNCLFLWQGSLFHPSPLSLFLIILRPPLQCISLRNFPWSPTLVQMSCLQLSYLHVLSLHSTYLDYNFIFISVIIWLRVTCSAVMSSKNVETNSCFLHPLCRRYL